MAEMHEDTGLQIHIDPYGKRHPLLNAWDTAEKIKSNNKKKNCIMPFHCIYK